MLVPVCGVKRAVVLLPLLENERQNMDDYE